MSINRPAIKNVISKSSIKYQNLDKMADMCISKLNSYRIFIEGNKTNKHLIHLFSQKLKFEKPDVVDALIKICPLVSDEPVYKTIKFGLLYRSKLNKSVGCFKFEQHHKTSELNFHAIKSMARLYEMMYQLDHYDDLNMKTESDAVEEKKYLVDSIVYKLFSLNEDDVNCLIKMLDNGEIHVKKADTLISLASLLETKRTIMYFEKNNYDHAILPEKTSTLDPNIKSTFGEYYWGCVNFAENRPNLYETKIHMLDARALLFRMHGFAIPGAYTERAQSVLAQYGQALDDSMQQIDCENLVNAAREANQSHRRTLINRPIANTQHEFLGILNQEKSKRKNAKRKSEVVNGAVAKLQKNPAHSEPSNLALDVIKYSSKAKDKTSQLVRE